MDEEDNSIVFHIVLVEDIPKLHCLLGPTSMAESAHRGIIPLVFALIYILRKNIYYEIAGIYMMR